MDELQKKPTRDPLVPSHSTKSPKPEGRVVSSTSRVAQSTLSKVSHIYSPSSLAGRIEPLHMMTNPMHARGTPSSPPPTPSTHRPKIVTAAITAVGNLRNLFSRSPLPSEPPPLIRSSSAKSTVASILPRPTIKTDLPIDGASSSSDSEGLGTPSRMPISRQVSFTSSDPRAGSAGSGGIIPASSPPLLRTLSIEEEGYKKSYESCKAALYPKSGAAETLTDRNSYLESILESVTATREILTKKSSGLPPVKLKTHGDDISRELTKLEEEVLRIRRSDPKKAADLILNMVWYAVDEYNRDIINWKRDAYNKSGDYAHLLNNLAYCRRLSDENPFIIDMAILFYMNKVDHENGANPKTKCNFVIWMMDLLPHRNDKAATYAIALSFAISSGQHDLALSLMNHTLYGYSMGQFGHSMQLGLGIKMAIAEKKLSFLADILEEMDEKFEDQLIPLILHDLALQTLPSNKYKAALIDLSFVLGPMITPTRLDAAIAMATSPGHKERIETFSKQIRNFDS